MNRYRILATPDDKTGPTVSASSDVAAIREYARQHHGDTATATMLHPSRNNTLAFQLLWIDDGRIELGPRIFTQELPR